MNQPEDLVAAIGGGRPGASVSLALWREGYALTVQAVLAARPAPPPPAPPSALENTYGFTVAADPDPGQAAGGRLHATPRCAERMAASFRATTR